MKRGLSEIEALEVIRRSVDLAVDARNAFWSEPANREGRLRPLVAASVGPYGAFLADGSEYTGDYDIGKDELYEFHRARWQVLAESEADLLACETIPSHREAEVLLKLLRETPERWAWLSFSCRNGTHISDGSPLFDVARACDAEPRVAAFGINCVAPEIVSDLIAGARQATTKPLIVYPNSGELYDAVSKTWSAPPGPIDWEIAAAEWTRLGVSGIGGCCRVGPRAITRIRSAIKA
jgi:homocysteine S-methyltransferase